MFRVKSAGKLLAAEISQSFDGVSHVKVTRTPSFILIEGIDTGKPKYEAKRRGILDGGTHAVDAQTVRWAAQIASIVKGAAEQAYPENSSSSRPALTGAE